MPPLGGPPGVGVTEFQSRSPARQQVPDPGCRPFPPAGSGHDAACGQFAGDPAQAEPLALYVPHYGTDPGGERIGLRLAGRGSTGS